MRWLATEEHFVHPPENATGCYEKHNALSRILNGVLHFDSLAGDSQALRSRILPDPVIPKSRISVGR
jgi:hypothetical protein